MEESKNINIVAIKPKVSVIVPAYNCENTILNTLDSILQQSFNDFELIIVDNNSTDNTVKIINTINDKRIRLLFCTVKGPAAARNYGIKKSQADLIAFIDADDLWDQNKLEESIRYLNKFDFVYHDLLLYKKTKDNFLVKGKLKSRKMFVPIKKDLLGKGNGIITSSVVLKKHLIFKAGLFDENINLFAAEDYDLWIRISEYTEKFRKIDKTYGKYLITGNNITNNKRKYIYTKELLKKYQKYLNKEFKKEILPWMSYNLLTSGYKSNIFENYFDNFLNVIKSNLYFSKKFISLVVLFLILLKLFYARFINKNSFHHG